jgi:hypothetical protein
MIISNKAKTVLRSAALEFDELADYIWKSPHLIDNETKIEKQKIKDYFPDNAEMAKLRWSYESRKLQSTFPYIIAVSNLYSVTSLLESYLLLLICEIESGTLTKLIEIKGNGISRYFNFFEKNGINLNDIKYYKQVRASLKIRNAFIHANGILKYLKESVEIRRIYSQHEFLENDHYKRKVENKSRIDEVEIIQTAHGEKLQISMLYAHTLAFYYREFLSSLIDKMQQLELDGTST